MQDLITKIPDYINTFALIGMIISLLATILVRITPDKSDDEKVDAIIQKFQKILHWLPTIGINPKTVKLQEAYDELKKKEEVVKSQ